MVQSQEVRGVKRSYNQTGETGKRRAPYALRACDACRRRKGKCDGRHPCRYCAGRGQSCNYDSGLESEDWQNQSISAPSNGDVVQVGGRRESKRTLSPTSCHSSNSNQEAIAEMLSTLQDQLDSLASWVQITNRDQPDLPSQMLITDAGNPINPTEILGNVTATAHSMIQKTSRAAASQSFYGPTSPDYALNVATLKLRRGDCHSRPPLQERQLQLASIDDEDVSDDGDDDGAQSARLSVSPRTLDRADPARLLTFRTIMSLEDAIQLLYIYQEVVGDLHPVFDIDTLISQTRSWYSDTDSGAWDLMVEGPGSTSFELLLILNLALAIALRADSKPKSYINEALLRDSFEDAVNAKLAAPANSIKHVTIIFLKGWYDFFQDMPRSAWRMIGIAGRTLMELGFHNGEVSKHTLSSEASRTEACTLMSSIVILDRQWSSATGLPIHFNDSSFSSIPTSSVKNSYLKAMLSFILISDQFSEPISKVAKGEGYNDEDAFELMNFQIEQWRRKAAGDYTIANFHSWKTDPSSRPPTWAILVNLRAESVRSLLLKPFFFSEAANIETTKNHVRPAAELVYDIIDVLHTLDTTTDIYRKLHPYFQHILACDSSLAFLLMSFIKQNRAIMLPSLGPDLVKSLGGSFLMAVALTTKYTKISRAARRLAKRLVEMRSNLRFLGILKDSNSTSGDQGDSMRDNEQEPLANTAKSLRRMSLAPSIAQDTQSYPEYSPGFASGASPGIFGALAPTADDTSMQMGWADSLRLQWPIGDVNNMFSESIF